MTEEQFLRLVNAETALELDAADLAKPFDALPQWDSVYLLKVLTGIETETGATVSMAALLEVTSLADVLRALAPAEARS